MGVAVGGRHQYVLFRLRAEEYGLPVSAVESIIRYERPTPVPRAPADVHGVINLRGEVVPVIDLGLRLLGGPFEPAPASRVIIARGAEGPLGLAVDAVTEVVGIGEEEIRETPSAAADPATIEAFHGVVTRDENLIILLDPDKVLPRTALPPEAIIGEEAADA